MEDYSKTIYTASKAYERYFQSLFFFISYILLITDPDERDKCLSQIIFLQKNKKTICKALKRTAHLSNSLEDRYNQFSRRSSQQPIR